MDKIYVLYGEEDFLINRAITDLQKSHQQAQINKYDLLETNLSNIIEDASMISLFDEEKIIVVYSADFLTGSAKKEVSENDIKHLDNYVDHPNPKTIIIFIASSDKLDKRKSIVKKLITKAKIVECAKLKDEEMIQYARNIFKAEEFQISIKALTMLIDRVGSNLSLLHNECEKLMIYKIYEKRIDEEDIEETIVKYDFDNIFALTDAVIKKDINTSLMLYQELLKRNEEPIKIIVMLANQFRLIYQVKGLYRKGFSESQIASELGVHPYRVKLANEVKLSGKEILAYINSLADLDADIKMGKANKDASLELFLLKL